MEMFKSAKNVWLNIKYLAGSSISQSNKYRKGTGRTKCFSHFPKECTLFIQFWNIHSGRQSGPNVLLLILPIGGEYEILIYLQEENMKNNFLKSTYLPTSTMEETFVLKEDKYECVDGCKQAQYGIIKYYVLCLCQEHTYHVTVLQDECIASTDSS